MAEEIIVFLTAIVPVGEVRASIPLGILYYHLSPVKTLILSILGNVAVVFPLLWFLSALTERLREIPSFDRFFEWLFARTRSKSKLIEDFELIGLAIFIGIPFPGTGVWTGVIAAYLMGLPWIPTFFCSLAGSAIASFIMLAVSLGIVRIF